MPLLRPGIWRACSLIFNHWIFTLLLLNSLCIEASVHVPSVWALLVETAQPVLFIQQRRSPDQSVPCWNVSAVLNGHWMGHGMLPACGAQLSLVWIPSYPPRFGTVSVTQLHTLVKSKNRAWSPLAGKCVRSVLLAKATGANFYERLQMCNKLLYTMRQSKQRS